MACNPHYWIPMSAKPGYLKCTQCPARKKAPQGQRNNVVLHTRGSIGNRGDRALGQGKESLGCCTVLVSVLLIAASLLCWSLA
jgi:hypothetical protein